MLTRVEVREPSPFGYFVVALRSFAVFRGRARRKEYWYFTLFYLLFSIALSSSSDWLGAHVHGGMLQVAASAVAFTNTAYDWVMWIPSLAVSVRRLHDTGKSGWLTAIIWGPSIIIQIAIFFAHTSLSSLPEDVLGPLGVVYLVIAIIFIIWYCEDSEPGTNRYGSNPKEAYDG